MRRSVMGVAPAFLDVFKVSVGIELVFLPVSPPFDDLGIPVHVVGGASNVNAGRGCDSPYCRSEERYLGQLYSRHVRCESALR